MVLRVLCLVVAFTTWITPIRAADTLTFEKDVRPILKAFCLDCHGGGEKVQGKLDLRLKRFLERGGDSGAAIDLKDPAKSLLVERMKNGDMPPGEKKVPPEQIAIIEKWLASGAKTLRPEPEQLPAGIDITPEERAYWFYQPLQRPSVPAIASHPIDALLLVKLREKGTDFAPEADRRTLIRRVALDLTGLPPTLAEVDEYLADSSPNAYERMVDHYLASPRYGERWGRHWLDVAGYADSDGDGTNDSVRPYAYKYRDAVIRAINEDKPIDRFIQEQLAGDELVPRPWSNLTTEQINTIALTGFLRTAPDGTTSGGDIPMLANQNVTDTLKIVSSSLLGLSVACAQCHDHRYDPIPQIDYFRLRAVFEPALNPSAWRGTGQRRISLFTDADRAKSAAIEAEVAVMQKDFNAKQAKFMADALDKELLKHPEALRTPLREAYQTAADKRTPEQKKLLESHPSVNISPGILYQYNQAAADELKRDQDAINAKRAQKPVEDFVALTDEVPNQLPKTFVHYRGDPRQPKQPVGPGDLTIAAPEGKRFEIPEKVADLPTSGRRLAFAKHLTNGTHPLFGRVFMNRVWLHHFGRGIVDTPGEFGILGVKPTHPELLDYLATELPLRGWSLKAMHRLMMTSRAYKQSSVLTAKDHPDAENRWYSRFPIRRLEAEAIRDRILATAGTMDLKAFGPAVPLMEDFVGQVVPVNDSTRRSIYLQVRRTKPVSLLTTFDAASVAVHCEKRVHSTSAPQSLMLMNSDFVLKQAEQVAMRVRKETPSDYQADVITPMRTAFARPTESWQFGYGTFDPSTKRTARFTAFSHWTGSSWQGGSTLPDAMTGWVLLHASGGHTGANPDHAAIRRWTSPADGIVAIKGTLSHGSPNGDGVRGRVVASGAGLVGEWSVKNGKVETSSAAINVKAGDTLDLITDCQGDVTSDSFDWPCTITLTASDGQSLGTWSSVAEFHGPITSASLPAQIAYAWALAYQRPITSAELQLAGQFVLRQMSNARSAGKSGDLELLAMTNLCQQLLGSNEFLYGD